MVGFFTLIVFEYKFLQISNVNSDKMSNFKASNPGMHHLPYMPMSSKRFSNQTRSLYIYMCEFNIMHIFGKIQQSTFQFREVLLTYLTVLAGNQVYV